MPHVTFVAPFLAETTLRFVAALGRLEGVRASLVTQDPLERIPGEVRPLLSDALQVRDALDPGVLVQAVEALRRRGEAVDLLLGTFEELQVPLGEVRDLLGIPGMGAAAAENFRDKSRMKDILREHDLPCARHTLARSPEETRSFVDRVGFPVIVKPPAGSGSRGTFRISSPDELESLLSQMPPSRERPALVEEFLTGEEHSFDAISLDGRVVWHSINHYLPSALEVLREPWIQWCVLLPRESDTDRYDAIRSVAGRALDALGMDTGLSHMEWFRRPDGSAAISEVGARPPGARFMNLISWAHDFDFFRVWAEVMVYRRFTPRPRLYAAGAAYLRAQGEGRVKAVHGLDEVARELGSLVVEARLPREGQSRSAGYEGEGYVIVRHPETDVVRDALWKIVTRVRVELG
ncbi:MAG: ATP-grasp domain-containing protein [Gemmatimonadota bacterium]|jgi:formate-dependent phosphoribosylglycinamide formyltransferase (GAR transformylase)